MLRKLRIPCRNMLRKFLIIFFHYIILGRIDGLNVDEDFIQCHESAYDDLTFPVLAIGYTKDAITPYECKQACLNTLKANKGYAFLFRETCRCKETFSFSTLSDHTQCNYYPCNGDSSMSCGGEVVSEDGFISKGLVYLAERCTIESMNVTMIGDGFSDELKFGEYIVLPGTYEIEINANTFPRNKSSVKSIDIYMDIFSDKFGHSHFFSGMFYNNTERIPFHLPGSYILKIVSECGSSNQELFITIKVEYNISENGLIKTFECDEYEIMNDNILNCHGIIDINYASALTSGRKHAIYVDVGDDNQNDIEILLKKFHHFFFGIPFIFGGEDHGETEELILQNIWFEQTCSVKGFFIDIRMTDEFTLSILKPQCDPGKVNCNGLCQLVCDNFNEHNLTIIGNVDSFQINRTIQGLTQNIGLQFLDLSHLNIKVFPGFRISINQPQVISRIPNHYTNEYLMDVLFDGGTPNTESTIALMVSAVCDANYEYEFAVSYEMADIYLMNITFMEDGILSPFWLNRSITVETDIPNFEIVISPVTSEEDHHIEDREIYIKRWNPTFFRIRLFDDVSVDTFLFNVSFGEELLYTNQNINDSFILQINETMIDELEVVVFFGLIYKRNVSIVVVVEEVSSIIIETPENSFAPLNIPTVFNINVTGSNYSCSFDFHYDGNSPNWMATIDSTNMFDIVSNTFTALGNCTILVECKNVFSSRNQSKEIVIEEEIRNIRFDTFNADLNHPYFIKASYDYGSNVVGELRKIENDNTETLIDINVDGITKSIISIEQPAVAISQNFKLKLKLSNYLGEETKEIIFVIDISLNRMETSLNISDSFLPLGECIQLEVSASSTPTIPTNTSLIINYGNGDVNTQQLIEGSTSKYNQVYCWKKSGRYLLTVDIHNMRSGHILFERIDVVGVLSDNLQLTYEPNPVPLTKFGGRASFKLIVSNSSSNDNGQPAEANCDWGDGSFTPSKYHPNSKWPSIYPYVGRLNHNFIQEKTYLVRCDIKNQFHSYQYWTEVNVELRIGAAKITTYTEGMGVSKLITYYLETDMVAKNEEFEIEWLVDGQSKQLTNFPFISTNRMDSFATTFDRADAYLLTVRITNSVRNYTYSFNKTVVIGRILRNTLYQLGCHDSQSKLYTQGIPFEPSLYLKFFGSRAAPEEQLANNTYPLHIHLFVRETSERLSSGENSVTDIQLPIANDHLNDQIWNFSDLSSIKQLSLLEPGRYTIVAKLVSGGQRIKKVLLLYHDLEVKFEQDPFDILFRPNFPFGNKKYFKGMDIAGDVFPINVLLKFIPNLQQGIPNEYLIEINCLTQPIPFIRKKFTISQQIIIKLYFIGTYEINLVAKYGASSETFSRKKTIKLIDNSVGGKVVVNDQSEIYWKDIGEEDEIMIKIETNSLFSQFPQCIFTITDDGTEKNLIHMMESEKDFCISLTHPLSRSYVVQHKRNVEIIDEDLLVFTFHYSSNRLDRTKSYKIYTESCTEYIELSYRMNIIIPIFRIGTAVLLEDVSNPNDKIECPPIHFVVDGEVKGINLENMKPLIPVKTNIVSVHIVKPSCNNLIRLAKEWKIYEIDDYGERSTMIDMEYTFEEKSMYNSEVLFLPANVILPRFYEFVFEVKYVDDLETTPSSISIFVNVTKARVEAKLFNSIASEILISQKNNLNINLLNNTYDYQTESLIDEKEVEQLLYFCRTIGDEWPIDIKTDWYDIRNIRLPFDKNRGGCYGSGSGRIGDGNSIELYTNLMKLNEIYELMGIIQMKDGRTSTTNIKLKLTEQTIYSIKIACAVPSLCRTVSDGIWINGGTKIVLISECLNCLNNVFGDEFRNYWRIRYYFDEDVRKELSNQNLVEFPNLSNKTLCEKVRTVDDSYWIYIDDITETTAIDEKTFVIQPELLNKYWMIKQFEISLQYISPDADALSKINVYINSPPTNGYCELDVIEAKTTDSIGFRCENWIDAENKLNRVKLFKKDPSELLEQSMLVVQFNDTNNDTNGFHYFYLPVGSHNLWYTVYDNMDASVTLFLQSINIYEDESAIDDILSSNIMGVTSSSDSLVNKASGNSIIDKIVSGSAQEKSNLVLSIVEQLSIKRKRAVRENGYSSSSNPATESIDRNEPISSFPLNMNSSFGFDDLSLDDKLDEDLMLSDDTPIKSIEQQQLNRRSLSARPNSSDEKVQEREKTSNFLKFMLESVGGNTRAKNIDESNLVAEALASLSDLSADMNVNTIESNAHLCNQLARTTQQVFGDTSSFQSIVSMAKAILKCSGNLMKNSGGTVAGRIPTLISDFDDINSIEASSDTDLENIWGYNRAFESKLNENTDEMIKINRNVRRHQQMAIQVAKETLGSIQRISSVAMKQMVVDEELTIPASDVRVTLSAIRGNEIKDLEVTEGFGKFTLPSTCDMSLSSLCSNTNFSTVKLQSISMTMAPSPKLNEEYGANIGMENDIYPVGMSNLMSLTLFDEKNEILKVEESQKEIEIFIPRDSSIEEPKFARINGTIDLRTQGHVNFKYHKMNLLMANASIHIDIRPLAVDDENSYLIILKRNDKAILNSTYQQIDDWKIVDKRCVVANTSNNYYSYSYLNTNNTFGNISIGIRELTEEEQKKIEEDSTGKLINLINDDPVNFTSDYLIRFYSSACYYYKNGKYYADGLRVGDKTTFRYTHCYSTHLSEFASGWIVLPTAIDFDYVFANASFAANPTIYSTIIIIFVSYLFLLIYSRRKDRSDVKKLGVSPLPDNNQNDDYFYEVIVYTGNRKNSGTRSNVAIILSSDERDTGIRVLEDEERPLFQRGSCDAFVLSTAESLGPLTYLRIWHDNSGKKNDASWYLRYVLVKDLQTKEKYYFMCQRWLAVEKGDHLIDRMLPVANEEETQQFFLLFAEKATKSMNDSHLWFSVFARPPSSTFTRVQRLTCCLTLLLLTMLMNIMYYDIQSDADVKSSSGSGLHLGPFHITQQQTSVGIISSIIILIPSLMIVELFRHTQPKTKPINQLHQALLKNYQQAKKVKNVKNFKEFSKLEIDPSSFMNLKDSRSPKHSATSIKRPSPHNSATSTKRPSPHHSAVSTYRRSNQSSLSLYDINMSINNSYKITENDNSKENHEKIKKKFMLPWWMVIVTYFLTFVICGISVFFIISKGIMFGDEKVADWLTSLVLSFFTSILFTQPIKVILMAAIISIICKKISKDDIGDLDELEFREQLKKNIIKEDEEYLHKLSVNSLLATRPRKRMVQLPNRYEQTNSRLKLEEEQQIVGTTTNIVLYIFVLFIMYLIAYGGRTKTLYELQENLQTTFVNDRLYPFPIIKSQEQFFIWFKEVFLPNIRATTWYNDQPPIDERGFIGDRTNRLLGYAVMRQVRLKKDKCRLIDDLKKYYNSCSTHFQLMKEDKIDYGVNWTKLTVENLEKWKKESEQFADYSNTLNVTEFRYSSATQLNSLPYGGKFAFYSGGGYVFEIRGSFDILLKKFQQLKNRRWINQQTRAIFVEWSLYNAWTNVYCSCQMLLEWLPSTGFVTSYHFEPMILTINLNGFELIRFIGEIIFFIITLVKTITFIRKIINEKWKTLLKSFWCIVDLLILIFSWSVCIIYIYRTIKMKEITSTFKKTSGNKYIRLDYMSFWNQQYWTMMGFVLFLSTIKILQLLQFNLRIKMLGRTLKKCSQELISFNIMFFFIFVAFCSAFYLSFCNRSPYFFCFVKTMYTGMEMMLGQFHFDDMLELKSPLLIMFICLYNFFVIWCLLSMFITIICDAFSQVKSNWSSENNDLNIISYYSNKIFGNTSYMEEMEQRNKRNKLLSTIEVFPRKIDEFLYVINEIYTEEGLNEQMYYEKLSRTQLDRLAKMKAKAMEEEVKKNGKSTRRLKKK
ncbi:hypothetical protein SNEBB_005250 [Seison nebaliae]|nr:hypothetical protein SNEBB_005250 [Seison nebaliae]